MAIIIGGNSTDIEPDMVRFYGCEGFLFVSEGVINSDAHGNLGISYNDDVL